MRKWMEILPLFLVRKILKIDGFILELKKSESNGK